ncbi:MAG: hypothetical protein NTZ26_14585 [Candidatus Aminicenantes bacterium]|nr:hypothetical protein [Candidatus Aminicenantes bacterium]
MKSSLAAWILGAALALAPRPGSGQTAPVPAPAPASEPAVRLKGVLSLRYAYSGSSAASTIGNSLRLTGAFRLTALGDKISLRYRSHHWINFQHTPNSVLESPYENRHILQTVALDTDGLIAPGVKTTLGRFFPDFDYASIPVMDGGSAGWEGGGFSVRAAAGRMFDIWTGKESGSDLFTAAQIKVKKPGFSASLGWNAGRFLGLLQKEIPAGVSVSLNQTVWLEAYGSYDLERSDVARAGFSASWHGDSTTFSVLASIWRNPFDQLYILDRTRASASWGLFDAATPALYRDLRVTGGWSGAGWGLRGSLGAMSGVRSGWLGSASITTPPVLGIRLTAGGQAMRTDMIEFYSLDIGTEGQWAGLDLRLQTQTRYYQWRPRASGFHNLDNYTELSAEYPLNRHVFAGLAGGGYFRQLGNEPFKPQAEFRMIIRL